MSTILYTPPLSESLPPPSHLPAFEDVHIRILDADHPQRRAAETWVKKVYLRAYRARLDSFYPWLLTVTNDSGQLTSVAGFRPAAGEPLFSEHYLDQPVEQLLQIPRHEIVEVGNLAPAAPGQARAMITTVTAFLHGAGFRQVVFTAVPQLFNAFHRLELQPRQLAIADPKRLPQGADGWGSYYAANPRVYSGDIAGGHAALCRNGNAIDTICQEAHALGRQYRIRLQ